MQQRVNSYASDTLNVRFRRRPLIQQIAIAAGALLIILLVAWLLFGRAGTPPPPPPGPQPVGVIVVQEQPVALTAELPGRTAPYETSEVRPQVDGIVRARLFTEGDYVSAGQPLYRIDSATYSARVANARAALARAHASTIGTTAQERRYAELLKQRFVSRQQYDDAVAAAGQARADVSAQLAALRSAEIDLARTTISAPISGRIGRSISTTGALVTASQDAALATIQRLDPIYVDIQQSSADLLRLREQILSGQVASDGMARVRLRLETGSTYPIEGTLRFADVTVDPTTGSQTIRAIFPNPQKLLLPGMFVRASLAQGTQVKGMLVPQRAVSRDERGHPTVLVVGAKGMSELRVIQTDRTIGDDWLVTGGLKPGDKVIVEGGPLMRPGMPVKPQPWHKP
jgi:membrane fusion protein (multidrug efflux system)